MYAQQQQLAYAPTPYSYTPSNNLTATINLDEEVKLAESSAERNLYESLAEIYSIIITLDALEKAYLRDSIPESEYTEICDRLLRQYKNNLADETVLAAFGDLERFKAEWDVTDTLPSATLRPRSNLHRSSKFQKPPSACVLASPRQWKRHPRFPTVNPPSEAPSHRHLDLPAAQQRHTSSPPPRTSSRSSMPCA